MAKKRKGFRTLIELGGLTAVGFIIWFGISWLNIFPEKLDLSLSAEREAELGKKITELVLAEEKTISEKDCDEGIKTITDRLIKNLEVLSLWDYKFYVVENPLVNAFTLPGGNIVVFSGLIKFSESPEEVAAVLAHEMGHAEKRHVVKKLATEIGIQVVLAALAGENATILHDISRNIVSGSFSRESEREADKFAIDLLKRSSIHPRHLSEFFDRLTEKYGDVPDYLKIISTHPGNDERSEAIKATIIPSNFNELSFDLDWEKIKSSLN